MTNGGNHINVLPIPSKIVPVVTPKKDKKKPPNTQDRGGSKESSKRISSLKKPTYQVHKLPKRPSEQKRVIDVPLTEI